jgi:hypothetical protein
MPYVVNVETGETFERDFTQSELEDLAQDALDRENAEKVAKTVAVAKAALLKKLGVTEDEAKLLLS